jgi:hypothetical protein
VRIVLAADLVDFSRHLDEEELAEWCAGRDAVYQLAALTIGARLAIAGT